MADKGKGRGARKRRNNAKGKGKGEQGHRVREGKEHTKRKYLSKMLERQEEKKHEANDKEAKKMWVGGGGIKDQGKGRRCQKDQDEKTMNGMTKAIRPKGSSSRRS